MIAFHETPATGPAADRAAAMQALVPVLKTERLILRAPRLEDFDTFASTVMTPRCRYFGHHEDRESAWYGFIQLNVTWLLRGHGAWTVTRRDSGAIAGFVLLGAEPGDIAPELGYLVTESAEGTGLAYEATTAARDFAFEVLEFDTLYSFVDPKNTRSAALAQRLGAARDPKAEAQLDQSDPIHVYRHHPKVSS